MAGGKETPRQKMIGMMYLVLTALLALQVSNAVLEKFAIINGTLEGLIHESSAKNAEVLTRIVDDGSKSSKPEILDAVKNAQEIRKISDEMVKYVDEVKKLMMKEAGAKGIDEAFINDHSSKVSTMMIDKNSGEKKTGVGVEFEKRLKEYTKRLEQLSGHKFVTLAKAPKDIEAFKNNEKHANKDFLTFTFENTPPVAAYASVTQIQTEILANEAIAMDELAKKVGASQKKFDKIVPMVRPVSSVVAAGAKYEADMFITASSSAIVPDMYYNGAKLDIVDEGGIKMGKVSFTAKGGTYDKDGFSKQTFKAKIMIDGEPFEKEIPFTVAQPVIKVTTGNAPTLYMNCGNTVMIEVPALGTNYNPSFSSSGADIRKGDKPGRVTIIPKQRKITVGVSNAGATIGNAAFDVKNVPDPKYIAYVGSNPVDLRAGIRANQLGNLRFVAEPEGNFKEEVPKDARYRIKRAEVILGRGTSGVQRLNATNENPDLRSWISQARPGDRIVIDIKDVSRRTFTDEEEKVTVKGSSGIISIPVN